MSFLLLIILVFTASFPAEEVMVSTTDATSSSEEEIISKDPAIRLKEEKYRLYIGEHDHPLPFKLQIYEPWGCAKKSLEGKIIHAVGTIGNDPKRIDFNFHKTDAEDADIPLHLSIRFTEGISAGKIVYDIFKDGNWSSEEQRISSHYKDNEIFDFRVRILNGKYIVYGNRRELGSFDQKMGLEGVDHVYITGDLVSLRVFHYGNKTNKK